MEVKIKLKGKQEPLIFKGDKIDVLDFEIKGEKYKQIRYMDFKKGISKSEYISCDIIIDIRTIDK